MSGNYPSGVNNRTIALNAGDYMEKCVSCGWFQEAAYLDENDECVECAKARKEWREWQAELRKGLKS